MTLKELRMWHWRQLMRFRNQENCHLDKAKAWMSAPMKLGYNPVVWAKREEKKAETYRKQANFHLGAVQVLNDSLPGTAENDCFEEEHHKSIMKAVTDQYGTDLKPGTYPVTLDEQSFLLHVQKK